MTIRRFFLTGLVCLSLAGCDGRYEKRFFIPVSAAPSAEVVAVVSTYASDNNISCTPREGFLLSCWKQPVFLSVLPTQDGTEICYSQMVAQLLPVKKSELATERLKAQLDKFGSKFVTVSVPTGTQCFAQSSE